MASSEAGFHVWLTYVNAYDKVKKDLGFWARSKRSVSSIAPRTCISAGFLERYQSTVRSGGGVLGGDEVPGTLGIGSAEGGIGKFWGEITERIEPFPQNGFFGKAIDEVETRSLGLRPVLASSAAPHLACTAFSLKDAEELLCKLIDGAERAVSLAASQSYPDNRMFSFADGAFAQGKVERAMRLAAINRTNLPARGESSASHEGTLGG
jgi:hypothetical protein